MGSITFRTIVFVRYFSYNYFSYGLFVQVLFVRTFRTSTFRTNFSYKYFSYELFVQVLFVQIQRGGAKLLDKGAKSLRLRSNLCEDIPPLTRGLLPPPPCICTKSTCTKSPYEN